MTRETFSLRLLSGALTAVSAYELWARWDASDSAAAGFPPVNDAIPVALCVALGFEIVVRALRRLEREHTANAGPTA